MKSAAETNGQLAARLNVSFGLEPDAMRIVRAGRVMLRVTQKNAEAVTKRIKTAHKTFPAGAYKRAGTGRSYPAFHAGMTTAEYVIKFQQHNNFMAFVLPIDFDALGNRPAALYENGALDFDVIEEPNDDYIAEQAAHDVAQVLAMAQASAVIEQAQAVPVAEIEELATVCEGEASQPQAISVGSASVGTSSAGNSTGSTLPCSGIFAPATPVAAFLEAPAGADDATLPAAAPAAFHGVIFCTPIVQYGKTKWTMCVYTHQQYGACTGFSWFDEGQNRWRRDADHPRYNSNDTHLGLPLSLKKLYYAHESAIQAALIELARPASPAPAERQSPTATVQYFDENEKEETEASHYAAIAAEQAQPAPAPPTVEFLAEMDRIQKAADQSDRGRAYWANMRAPERVEILASLGYSKDQAKAVCTVDLAGSGNGVNDILSWQVADKLEEQKPAEIAPTPPAVESQPAATPPAVETESSDYSISAARYCKDKVAVSTPSPDGFKTRAARLAGTFGRWSRRNNGYVMTQGQADKFARLYAEGWDASIMGEGAKSRETPKPRTVEEDYGPSDLDLANQAVEARNAAPALAMPLCPNARQASTEGVAPTIKSKSGKWNAWFLLTWDNFFRLEFEANGARECSAHNTASERMAALQTLARQADAACVSPASQPPTDESGPTPSVAESGAHLAPPVAVSSASAAPEFERIKPFNLDPRELLADGVPASRLIGLGVRYNGNMASPSGHGAITNVVDSRGEKWGALRIICTLEDGRTIDATPHYFTAQHRPILQFNGKYHGAPYLAELATAAMLKRSSESSAAELAKTAHAKALAALPLEFPYLQQHQKGGKLSGCTLAAANIRAMLKRAFPGVKFSVRSSSFAGGNSIDVSWTDGPTSAQVDAITGRFSGGHFDSSSDCYEYSSSAFTELFGNSKYITARRELSDAAVLTIIAQEWPQEDGRPNLDDYRQGRLNLHDECGRNRVYLAAQNWTAR